MNQLNFSYATFGMWELILIFLIVVVIFGAGKLPQLGEALGKSIRNFKKGVRDETREIEGEAKRIDQNSPSQLNSHSHETSDKNQSNRS